MTEGTGIGIEAHLEALHVSATSARSVTLVVNELVINAIRHVNPDGGAGVIRVSVRREGGDVRIVVAEDCWTISARYPLTSRDVNLAASISPPKRRISARR
jgi:two-component sensor histidine kinase